jgi:hypothetical protein
MLTPAMKMLANRVDSLSIKLSKGSLSIIIITNFFLEKEKNGYDKKDKR